MEEPEPAKQCLLCGGKLRKFTKHTDWAGRRFHLRCWIDLESSHLDCSTYFAKLKTTYEKLETKRPLVGRSKYIKRKGIKLEFIDFEKPVTLYFD